MLFAEFEYMQVSEFFSFFFFTITKKKKHPGYCSLDNTQGISESLATSLMTQQDTEREKVVLTTPLETEPHLKTMPPAEILLNKSFYPKDLLRKPFRGLFPSSEIILLCC